MSSAQKSAAKRKNSIDDDDSSPDDKSYKDLREKKQHHRKHVKRHYDPALKVNLVWDGGLSRFVRRSIRTKQVTQLFCRSENFEGHKVGTVKRSISNTANQVQP